MKNRTILIVTDELDLHTDAVILKLREMGHSPVRLNLGDIPTAASFTIREDSSSWGGELCTRNHTISLEEVRSIWWRKPPAFKLPPGLDSNEQHFARSEITHAMSGLWGTIDCYWMSHPGSIRDASWKPGQLKRAVALGFEIPKTIFTTDPEAARDFLAKSGSKVAYKTMSSPFLHKPARFNSKLNGPLKAIDHPIESDLAVHTTLIEEDDLLSNLESIRNAPCQFQEYIEKKFELRVTVIGDEVFAAEIDSQAQPETKIDWRNYDVPMLLREASLPPEIRDRCLAMAKSYGLNFSAMDLIVTPDDRFVFLENNPNGQAFFVENQVPNLKMIDAVARCLARGNEPG